MTTAWVKSEHQLERERIRRSRGRRSASIATASTIVFLVLVVTVVTNAPGWPRVQDSFFSWEWFVASLPDVWDGFLLNIKMFLIAEPLILVVGVVVAVVRGLKAPVFFPLRALAIAYTDIFRGIPTLLLIYLVGFGLPGLRLQGIPNDPVVLGIIALTLSYGAYVAAATWLGCTESMPALNTSAT